MSDRIWTILELLNWSTGYFEERNLDSPRLDAELLLGFALGISRIQVYTQFDRPLESDELQRYRALVVARARDRTPIAYLLGRREFWSLDLEVSPAVLVPRPDTERLVELVSKLATEHSPNGQRLRICDVGTGSGAIALALKSEHPDADVWATDISPEALAVAANNGQRLELEVHWVEADLLGDAFRAGDLLDIVVSNPPYLTPDEMEECQPELRHEPRLALADSDTDGLGTVRRLAAAARGVLASGGLLAVEIGHQQGQAAQDALATAGFEDVALYQDLGDNDRVVIGRAP